MGIEVDRVFLMLFRCRFTATSPAISMTTPTRLRPSPQLGTPIVTQKSLDATAPGATPDVNAANLSTNTTQSTVTVTPTTLKDEEEHEEVEQQPELHQTETAVTGSSSHREGVRNEAAAEVVRGAEGGGIGELLGGSGGTVPSMIDEGLFSHRVMEEGECGPLDLSEYKVWKVIPYPPPYRLIEQS